jgi:hypothetical protein
MGGMLPQQGMMRPNMLGVAGAGFPGTAQMGGGPIGMPMGHPHMGGIMQQGGGGGGGMPGLGLYQGSANGGGMHSGAEMLQAAAAAGNPMAQQQYMALMQQQQQQQQMMLQHGNGGAGYPAMGYGYGRPPMHYPMGYPMPPHSHADNYNVPNSCSLM